MLFQLPATAAELSISSSTSIATAGYYQLSWSSDPASETGFLLQESHQQDFASTNTLYQGTDTSSLISGKANGTYYYRVALLDDAVAALTTKTEVPWSKPVAVNVAHHSLEKAFGFFIAGLIVFLASLLTIFIGNRKAGE